MEKREQALSEILRVEWFDVHRENKDKQWRWLHEFLLSSLQSQTGVNWLAHYKIVPLPTTPYVGGAPVKKEIKDPKIPTGQENLIITSASSASVFLETAIN